MSFVGLIILSTKWGACSQSISPSCGFSNIAFCCELGNQSLLGRIQFCYLGAEFGNVSVLLPNFIVFIWFILVLSLFTDFMNLVVVWGNWWTQPLLVRIGYGVERTIRQMYSFCRARWCIAVIFSYRLEFRYPSRCEWCCFASWNLGGNFLQNIGVFLAVAAIINFDSGHKYCQLCSFKFLTQQVYDVLVVHGATVSIQNFDCILKLAIKDLKCHGPFIPVGKGLQRFLGLVDIWWNQCVQHVIWVEEVW